MAHRALRYLPNLSTAPLTLAPTTFTLSLWPSHTRTGFPQISTKLPPSLLSKSLLKFHLIGGTFPDHPIENSSVFHFSNSITLIFFFFVAFTITWHSLYFLNVCVVCLSLPESKDFIMFTSIFPMSRRLLAYSRHTISEWMNNWMIEIHKLYNFGGKIMLFP